MTLYYTGTRQLSCGTVVQELNCLNIDMLIKCCFLFSSGTFKSSSVIRDRKVAVDITVTRSVTIQFDTFVSHVYISLQSYARGRDSWLQNLVVFQTFIAYRKLGIPSGKQCNVFIWSPGLPFSFNIFQQKIILHILLHMFQFFRNMCYNTEK